MEKASDQQKIEYFVLETDKIHKDNKKNILLSKQKRTYEDTKEIFSYKPRKYIRR